MSQDQGGGSSSGKSKRVVRFQPRKPRRPAPPVPQNRESQAVNDENTAAEAKKIFKANLTGQRHKIEKKSSVQVAFDLGYRSSVTIRSFGGSMNENVAKNSDFGLEGSTSEDEKTIPSLASTAKEDEIDAHSLTVASAPKVKKKYKEPWDYFGPSNPPITLPIRPPLSGDPEILDEEEFGEAAANQELNEDETAAAADLELTETQQKEQFFFLQFPTLPVVTQSAGSREKQKSPNLAELPAGHMGKLLVYKNGEVKLKMGDNLFAVNEGIKVSCPQDIAVLDLKEKCCCSVGKLEKTMVITPDLDSLFASSTDSGSE